MAAIVMLMPAHAVRTLGPRASISLVVPVYNAEATLTELVTRAAAVLPAAANRHEIVLVNDGSADRSWAGLKGTVSFGTQRLFVFRKR